jgi:exopolysaccharide biosynthesis polyprenyl glycosylphosphotransferase
MDAKEVFGHKYLGSVGHIRKALNAEPIDYAIFSVYRQDPAAVERAILACQERGIEIWLKPDFIQKITLSHVDYLESIPLFIFSFAPKSQFALLIKRIIDVVGSLAALTILAIPMLIITMAIKSTSKGAAIFKQKRIGLNGRRFIMYKFRTMQSESQQRKTELKLKNEMKGPAFKMKKDPRVTRIGCSLRKYSMDELPQLWNVLLGDMSFVGPRPPLPSEVNLYEGWQRRRLSMRPGLTCIWQVEGRNRISDFEEWVKLDLKYIDTWSLWLDLKILLKTIPAVLKGTGC